MRAVTYSRVSTSHHDQNPGVQVQELRRYCETRGWGIAREIVDHGFSGASDNRPGLKQLLALARAKEIEVVAVVKLDRLFRSLKHLVSTLEEFEKLGVQFVAIKDQIDMTTASGRLMLHIVAAFGEFERSLIRERTVAGLIHARSLGKALGRPRIHNESEIVRLYREGLSYRKIQKTTGAPLATISKAIKAVHKTSSFSASHAEKGSVHHSVVKRTAKRRSAMSGKSDYLSGNTDYPMTSRTKDKAR